jgi:hypothetical protein
VLNTKCHVSDRFNAASAVSLSLISQTNMMSGSSRIEALKAFEKLRVSCQTSLWFINDFFGVNMNSIGSSIVIMFSFLISFRWFIIDTIEVDFQDQVGQVTRYNHFVIQSTFFFMLSAISANIKSSMFLGSSFIFLITTANLPIFKKALTLYAIQFFERYAKSVSLSHINFSNIFGFQCINCLIMISISSSFIIQASSYLLISQLILKAIASHPER